MRRARRYSRRQGGMVASTRSSFVPCGAVPINRGTLVFHWCCPDGYNGALENLASQIYEYISIKYT